ncbi:DUF3027 domain-containing protein [Nakamurella silvestris]|nr:DUF3027 domain-containing protein [Nakamurella silvestris]
MSESPLLDGHQPPAADGAAAELTPPQIEVELTPAQIDLARQAAVEEAENPALVGEYLGARAEDDVAVTAQFGRPDAAYRGWAWSVTIAVLPGSEPTISEVVLLPGEDSLLAPAWLPWDQRIRPGDLGPGDLLAPIADDIRVVPAYLQSDDPAVEDVAHELGIGRVRVLSRFGREDAAARWREGEFGPDSDMAKQAPLNCVLCAFYLPLAGSLGAVSGVCGNDISPADGRVVDQMYGCGAHSEIVLAIEPSNVGNVPIDETTMDIHPRIGQDAVADVESESEAADQLEAEAEIEIVDEAEAAAEAEAVDEAVSVEAFTAESTEDLSAEAAAVASEPADGTDPERSDR